jgi:predicted short-subunit dehydrogenase-like oxidoreductase (DUF2520 family)
LSLLALSKFMRLTLLKAAHSNLFGASCRKSGLVPDNLKYHPVSGAPGRSGRGNLQRSVSIIGPGNWGSSLAHALGVAGVPLHEVIVPATLNRAQLEAGVLWLCVPDAAIAAVTRRLVRRVGARGLKGQIVVHSSGALSSEVLQAAADVGASVASVHPVMSFPTRTPVALQGVPFGVEAEAAARRILYAIIGRIGGRPFPIKASGAGARALYHAVGVLSSPLLVSHLVAAQEAAALAGFSPRQARQLIEPIARATLDNVFRAGAEKSFSGPIARGDVQTIRLHLQALEAHPILASVYRSLALYALEALPGQGKEKLRRLLR